MTPLDDYLASFKTAVNEGIDGMSGETHTGWLLSLMLRGVKDKELIVVKKYHYTADGCTALFELVAGGKTYRVNIQEEK